MKSLSLFLLVLGTSVAPAACAVNELPPDAPQTILDHATNFVLWTGGCTGNDQVRQRRFHAAEQDAGWRARRDAWYVDLASCDLRTDDREARLDFLRRKTELLLSAAGTQTSPSHTNAWFAVARYHAHLLALERAAADDKDMALPHTRTDVPLETAVRLYKRQMNTVNRLRSLRLMTKTVLLSKFVRRGCADLPPETRRAVEKTLRDLSGLGDDFR